MQKVRSVVLVGSVPTWLARGMAHLPKSQCSVSVVGTLDEALEVSRRDVLIVGGASLGCARDVLAQAGWQAWHRRDFLIAAGDESCDALVEGWFHGVDRILVRAPPPQLLRQLDRPAQPPVLPPMLRDRAFRDETNALLAMVVMRRAILSVLDVAEALGTCERQLRRRVEGDLGLSPGAVIRNCRSSLRDYLLLAGLTGPRVARALGHASERAFYGSLRNETGYGAREWARRLRTKALSRAR